MAGVGIGRCFTRGLDSDVKQVVVVVVGRRETATPTEGECGGMYVTRPALTPPLILQTSRVHSIPLNHQKFIGQTKVHITHWAQRFDSFSNNYQQLITRFNLSYENINKERVKVFLRYRYLRKWKFGNQILHIKILWSFI